jgi:hypothetical protein
LINSAFDIPIFTVRGNQSLSALQSLIDRLPGYNVEFDSVMSATTFDKPSDSPRDAANGEEFDSKMSTQTSSKICLQRNRCQPIGGHSVWSTFSSSLGIKKKPIIMVMAKFDSNAFFRDLAYGATSKTGPVVILAIMDALSKVNVSKKVKAADFFIA